MPHSPLLLQLVIILVTARLCGLLLRYAGQPTVVGEMAAGIVLGPIVFGALFPDFHAQLFAPASLAGPSSLSLAALVLVMVVIESLRAFDLVWIINKGRNGLELISALVAQNVIGEATRYGFGSALAVIMMIISTVFIVIYLRIVFREERG